MPTLPDSLAQQSSSRDSFHSITIKVGDDGKSVIFANLSLNEKIGECNHFTFIWKNEFNDSYTDDQDAFIQEFIGKKITISFDDLHVFKGIITSISYYKTEGLTQEFSVSGYGNAHKLLDQSSSASYYKKSLKDIIDSAMTGIPSNELAIDVNPQKTDKLFYTVQYQEPDFVFLQHLAIRFGEWFYYNGEKLKFGKLENETYEVLVGIDIQNVNVATQITPMKRKGVAFDPYKGEIINTDSQGTQSSGMLSALFDASDSTFERTPQKPQILSNASVVEILESNISTEIEANTARLLTLTATSRDPKIKLGSKLKITDKSNKSTEYIVISISHTSLSPESYQNRFTCVLASAKVPPYTNPHYFPKAMTQNATVKENEDKDGHDRLKVQFPWQQSNETTPWISMQTPYAGKGKGFRIMPEKGEKVIVGFEHNNAEKPYVIGSVYNEAQQSGHTHSNNDIKVFRTSSGTRLIFDDSKGAIKIYDKSGSYIKMDGSGNIEICAGKNLTIKAGEAMKIESKKDMELVTEQNLKQTVKQKLTLKADQDAIVESSANIKMAATQDIKVDATSNLSMNGVKIKAKGTAGVEIDGAQIQIKGDATAEIASPMTTVKGDGMTTIKGGMVMIN